MIAAGVAVSLLACRGSAQEAQGETVMTQPKTDCSATLEAGGDLATALASAPDGAILCLPPGTYGGSHELTRSVTLRGLGDGVVLDADASGFVIGVQTDKITVALEGITLTGGSWEAGGGLTLTGRSEVTITGCTIKGNAAPTYGGGGLYASRGTLRVKDSIIEGNRSGWGGGVLADTVATVALEGTTVRGNTGARGGGIAVRDGALLELTGSTVAGNTASDADGAPIYVAGTTTRGPEVVIRTSSIDGEVHDSIGNATITRP